MDLYVLERVGDVGYDEYSAFVVAAEGPVQAREIAVSQSSGDEPTSEWLNPACSEIELIGYAAPHIEASLILSDFNAG